MEQEREGRVRGGGRKQISGCELVLVSTESHHSYCNSSDGTTIQMS